jgi:ABC-type Na+ efflux pump permease subunit
LKVNKRRVRAIFYKEIREYRRNGSIIATMAVLPLIFVLTPTIQAFAIPTSAVETLRHDNLLLYLLAIPALVPATISAYSIVGERQQGTLEPVLATPILRTELLLGKALASFVPTIVVAYLVYGLYVAVVELFAHPGVATALIRGPELAAQLLFTPLIAAMSIWIGITISTRCNDIRTAQQLGAVAGLPIVAVTSLISFNVIHATLTLALGCAVALLLLDRLGWRVVSAAFDRERLITGTKS